MKCKICGTEHYTKECPTCINRMNMKNAILKEENNSKLRIIIPSIIIIIIVFIVPTVYIMKKKLDSYEAVEKANVALVKLNDRLSADNNKLQNKVNH